MQRYHNINTYKRSFFDCRTMFSMSTQSKFSFWIKLLQTYSCLSHYVRWYPVFIQGSWGEKIYSMKKKHVVMPLFSDGHWCFFHPKMRCKEWKMLLSSATASLHLLRQLSWLCKLHTKILLAENHKTFILYREGQSGLCEWFKDGGDKR